MANTENNSLITMSHSIFKKYLKEAYEKGYKDGKESLPKTYVTVKLADDTFKANITTGENG